MANRDQDDPQYNRSEGRFDRDDQGYSSQRNARDWDRQNDEWRRAQARNGEQYSQRGTRSQQFGDDSPYSERTTGTYESGGRIGSYGSYDRGVYDRGSDDRQRAQSQSQPGQEWNRSVGSYSGPSPTRDWGHNQSQIRPQGNYASEWRTHPQDWTDHGRDFDRNQSFGAQGYGRSDPFAAQERNRQEWNRTLGSGRSAYGQQPYGQPRYGQSGSGREEESWGEQIRHAGEQVVNRVKRAFRGPKGYKRSDERIREDVNDRLAQQYDFDPSDVEVQVANGEVTLTGTVRTRHEKFIAEEITDDVSGVNEVHNQIRVRRDDQTSSLSSGTTTTTTSATTQSEASRNRNSPRA